MEILLTVLGSLALLAGLAGLVLPAFPGPPVMAAGVLLLAWAGDFARIGWGTVVFAAVLGAAMMIVDWLAGILGARRFGASRWAAVGAALGLLAGIFFGFPGILLGPVAGAVALELAKDPDVERALRAGFGVFLGFVVGTALKVALGFVMVGAVILALLV